MSTPIEELERRQYRCRHLAYGDTCGLAGQENKRPTLAQEGFGDERPTCRLAHTVAKGTTLTLKSPMALKYMKVQDQSI